MSPSAPRPSIKTSLASFRFRLTFFFIALVVVPMISVALILFRLISDSENGKADARVAAELRVAQNVYRHDLASADAALKQIGIDRRLASALAVGDIGVLRHRARVLATEHGVRRLVLLRGSHVLVDVGARSATAPAARNLVAPHGRRLGQLQVAVDTAPAYASTVRTLAGADVAVQRNGSLMAATVKGLPDQTLPRVGNVSASGRQFRVASFDATGFHGVPVRVSVLGDRSATSSSITSSRLLAAGILGVFFLVAFGCAVWLSRSLQRQIAAFLAAARRLGRGDFSAKVPVAGNDEFAALGEEFNKMSGELEARLEELRDQRVRLESSLQRVGEAFASNLDRDALLEVVLRTAVDGVGAEGGRASTRLVPGGPLEERARVGQVRPFAKLVERVEARVLETQAAQESEGDAGWALTHPLHMADGGGAGDGGGPVLGLITVTRSDRAFTPGERELFGYLAGQAGVSIENVSLHETVQRQAVTDEVTGLFNHRRFQEALVSEVERSRRFQQAMSLVMLDIDNFKWVNDTYGHQQGDMVLREVARILRENSREIDAPARYGGEELAVVLPQTDESGAYNLAERVRQGIEELELPLLDGHGTMSVTASLGVASLPSGAANSGDLVAAADAALYRAKRSGKNCTMRAA